MAPVPTNTDGRDEPAIRDQPWPRTSARRAAPGPHREAERPIAVEQRGRIARARAFDREQAQFRRDPAVGGETAHLAAGREHAVARHDDREWAAPCGLTHV